MQLAGSAAAASSPGAVSGCCAVPSCCPCHPRCPGITSRASRAASEGTTATSSSRADWADRCSNSATLQDRRPAQQGSMALSSWCMARTRWQMHHLCLFTYLLAALRDTWTLTNAVGSRTCPVKGSRGNVRGSSIDSMNGTNITESDATQGDHTAAKAMGRQRRAPSSTNV